MIVIVIDYKNVPLLLLSDKRALKHLKLFELK